MWAPHDGGDSNSIVDSTELMLTDNHVLTGAEMLTIALADGQEFTAIIVGRDIVCYLAVIHIGVVDEFCRRCRWSKRESPNVVTPFSRLTALWEATC
jgi:hypothetical protein